MTLTGPSPKILAIDDTPSALIILHKLLKEFDVQTANSGAQGLDMAVASPPDLILLDVMMPEMDGYQVFKLLKANDRLSEIPIIFITSLNDATSESTGLALGAADYITKPFNSAIVSQRIKNVLERENLLKQSEAQRKQLEMFADTTARQFRALQDSEARKGAILEASIDCLITIDAAGRIVDCNPAAEKAFGYQRQEVIGCVMADIILAPAHRNPSAQNMQAYLRSGLGPMLHERVEVNALRRSGLEFPVELAIVPFKSGDEEHFLASIRDISERKAFEVQRERMSLMQQQLLRELSAQQFALDEHAIVSFADLDGNITYANQKLCEISQYRLDELLGKPHRILKSGLHGSDYYQAMWSTIKAGKVWHGELANRNRDGEIYWLAATIVPLPGDDGLPYQYISIRTDITHQKRTEQELELAHQRELDIGNQIQRSLLFGDVPRQIGSMSIAAYTEPSKGIDGDFYEFFRFSSERFDLSIGDVMGKGIPAALIGAAVKQGMNQILAEQLADASESGQVPEPEILINLLHQKISQRLINLDRFVTMTYMRFDLVSNRVTFVDAGHTNAILVGSQGIRLLSGNNLPLGVVEDERYEQHEVELNRDDLMFLYSDGITEARGPKGEEFGVERLSELIHALHFCDIPASIMIQMVRKTLHDFEQKKALEDDRTCIALKSNLLAQSGRLTADFDLLWQYSDLHRLRDEIEVLAEQAGLSDDMRDALILAGFEVVTNVVRHTPRPLPDAIMHVRLEDADDSFNLDVYHLGEVCEYVAREPDFSGESESGFGLYIIKNSVDEAIYDNPCPGVCRARLRKLKH